MVFIQLKRISENEKKKINGLMKCKLLNIASFLIQIMFIDVYIKGTIEA